jgi:hypothetical protein
MQISVLPPFCAGRLIARAIFGGPIFASSLDLHVARDPDTAAVRFNK